MVIDDVIDEFVDTNDETTSLLLLKALSRPEQGGPGYALKFFNPTLEIDGFEVDHVTKSIQLDTEGLFSEHSVADVATALRDALQQDIAETHAGLLERVGWGTGKVVVGVVEAAIGLVGIVVPEPGTTAAGVAVFVLGGNSIIDGFSQLAGANKGHGYNILGEGAGELGANIASVAGYDTDMGRAYGKGAFFVSSVALGSLGSIRILRLPSQAFLRTGLGGQTGGFAVGRLDMAYGSYRAKDGLTVLSINNNAGKSILRFVTHDGRLVVNGRIYGVKRVLDHETKGREIIRGLLQMLAHGAKQGW